MTISGLLRTWPRTAPFADLCCVLPSPYHLNANQLAEHASTHGEFAQRGSSRLLRRYSGELCYIFAPELRADRAIPFISRAECARRFVMMRKFGMRLVTGLSISLVVGGLTLAQAAQFQNPIQAAKDAYNKAKQDAQQQQQQQKQQQAPQSRPQATQPNPGQPPNSGSQPATTS